jgi:tetratricopeptide (TPR) repeat protein
MREPDGRTTDVEQARRLRWAGRLSVAVTQLASAPSSAAVATELATNLLLLGQVRKAMATLDDALTDARQRGDAVDEAMLLLPLSAAYRRSGGHATAVEVAARSLELHASPAACLALARAYLASGRPAAADALVAEARADTSVPGRVEAELVASELALSLGSAANAGVAATQAVRLAREHPHLSARAITQLARCLVEQRDYGAGRKLHRRALALHRKHGHRDGVVASLGGLALTAMGTGMVAESARELHGAIKLAEESEAWAAASAWRSALDRALVLLDRPEPRIRALQAWLPLVRRLGDHTLEAWALCELGNTCREIRDREAAVDWYRQALARSTETGDPHAAAVDRLNLGITLAELRDPEALVHLDAGLQYEGLPDALVGAAHDARAALSG